LSKIHLDEATMAQKWQCFQSQTQGETGGKLSMKIGTDRAVHVSPGFAANFPNLHAVHAPLLSSNPALHVVHLSFRFLDTCKIAPNSHQVQNGQWHLVLTSSSSLEGDVARSQPEIEDRERDEAIRCGLVNLAFTNCRFPALFDVAA
jgi:hypothetical protein